MGIMGEYVYAVQLSGEKKGYTLPFSPPASFLVNVKYQKQFAGRFEQVSASVDYRLTAPQNRIVPPEVPTPGYQLFNIGLGAILRMAGQPVSISLQIQNLLNTKYFNHTSYYRLINIPEPGRNIILNISMPFTLNQRKNVAN
jgi:iron complex outermembrane receptor protein